MVLIISEIHKMELSLIKKYVEHLKGDTQKYDTCRFHSCIFVTYNSYTKDGRSEKRFYHIFPV